VDIHNIPIYGTGAWHAPGLLDKFNGAMLCLHNAYKHPLKVYFPVCAACVHCHKQYKNSPHYVDTCFGSCTAHPGCPQLIPKGNPMVSNLVTTYIRQVKESLSGWEVKGNVQLLPGEVRHLRQYLIGSGSIENFQVYVMILLGIKLFLCADE
jgi:predicted amidophosphoribosyltransferase